MVKKITSLFSLVYQYWLGRRKQTIYDIKIIVEINYPNNQVSNKKLLEELVPSLENYELIAYSNVVNKEGARVEIGLNHKNLKTTQLFEEFRYVEFLRETFSITSDS